MPPQCRTCGGTIYNTDPKNLFEIKNSVMLKQIQLLTGVPLINHSNLPSCICACCVADLRQAITFRERCIRIQELLLQHPKANTDRANDDNDILGIEDDDIDEIKQEVDNEAAAATLSADDFDKVDDLLGFSDDDEIDNDAKDARSNDSTADESDFLTEEMQNDSSICIENSNYVDDFSDIDEFQALTGDSVGTSSNISSAMAPSPKSIAITMSTQSPQHSVSGRITHMAKKNYVSWKNLTEDEIVQRKREMRRRDCVCDQCGRHFTDQSNFKLHLLRHTGIKNYTCNECGKQYYTEHLLSLHVRIVHKGEKPYACKYCPKTFHNSTTRVVHERIHTKARPYGCSHCDKSFSSAAGRKRHELIHTDKRDFHCATCDQRFKRSTHLKAHQRSKQHIHKEETLQWTSAVESE